MSDSIPAAAAVLSRFLDWRGRTVSPRTLARDHEVLRRLTESIEAHAPSLLDEVTLRRLERERSRGVATLEVVDAYAIIDGAREFLDCWLPLRCHASAREIDTARLVLRQLVRWMERLRVVEPCSTIHLLGHLDGESARSRRRNRLR